MRITKLSFLTFLLILGSFASAQSTPPKILAIGNQIYCAGTSIKIVTNVTITHDPIDPGSDAIYIQISSGYVFGEDLLTLANAILHPTIATTWIPAEGKLKLSSPTGNPVPFSDFENAIKDVIFTNSSLSASGTRDFSINIGFGTANYLPRNGHFYEFVPNLDITWIDAKALATTKFYYGLRGYLATLTAADEAQLAGAQAPGAGWIGGSDAATEGVWKWETGPEGLANGGAGTVFWNGNYNGSSPNYAFWNTNNNFQEPNNLNGNEHYAHITNPNIIGSVKGGWNDLANTGGPGLYRPQGFIVEYGGMPGDPILEVSASTTITINRISSTTPASRCAAGSVTLQSTASNGAVNWFESATAGTILFTGSTYTTPPLTSSTTYYVATGCSPRTPIIATINSIPIVSVIKAVESRCGSGTVILDATTNIGIINWYLSPTGGTIQGTGTSFTTPNLTANTNYYAEAENNGCVSIERKLIEIKIYNPPLIQDQELTKCQSSTITLDALLPNMSYLWSTGETTQQIMVSQIGNYTADITSLSPENCTSRANIMVIENEIPEINIVEVNQTTVVINLKNPQNYFEYSIDGINYQSSNVFSAVSSGLQTAFVRDKYFCAKDSEVFTVLIIPKFFTPNNDNYNDVWEIKGLVNYPSAEVSIFDRYGKLIARLDKGNLSWDGTFNKIQLPASDYWYILKIDSLRIEKKGHFSLKR
jgi:gliding motility-associated-like protein